MAVTCRVLKLARQSYYRWLPVEVGCLGASCIRTTDQFRSRGFVHALNHHEMVGSMGRVGATGGNTAMESFFSLLQKNVLDRRRWDTREQLRIAIVTWIERPYHRRRRQP